MIHAATEATKFIAFMLLVGASGFVFVGAGVLLTKRLLGSMGSDLILSLAILLFTMVFAWLFYFIMELVD